MFEKTISKYDISIKSKVYTKAKLEVLEDSLFINKIAMRIGDFNSNGINLKIDKIIGGTNYCIGFSNKENSGKTLKYYYPKSLLKADIKDYTTQDNRVIATLTKEKRDKVYSNITYLSKNINPSEILKSPNIINKIEYEEVKKKHKI